MINVEEKFKKLESGIQQLIKDIQEEIEACPNCPNIGIKGYKNRLSNLLEEVNG